MAIETVAGEAFPKSNRAADQATPSAPRGLPGGGVIIRIMLVAELIAPRQFRLVEQEMEDLRPGEVRVRVNAVGICGSDLDRKSTRLNSSHRCISYAVFCLKKKK